MDITIDVRYVTFLWLHPVAGYKIFKNSSYSRTH